MCSRCRKPAPPCSMRSTGRNHTASSPSFTQWQWRCPMPALIAMCTAGTCAPVSMLCSA
jgi:hypothetical protein